MMPLVLPSLSVGSSHQTDGAVAVDVGIGGGGRLSAEEGPIRVDVINRDCDMSNCPEASFVDPECPHDSVLRVASEQPDECCPRQRICECDFTRCLHPVCPEGHSLIILHKGLDRPGQCCNILDCVMDEELGKQCLSNGLLYGHGEFWHEDACVQCTCEKGEKICHAESCQLICDNPQYIPGRCCPICLPEIPILTTTTNVEEEEEVTSECSIQCPFGFVTNDRGKEKCECAEPPTPKPTCPPLVNCKKTCTYGYRKNLRNGCEKCRCNKCPPTECNLNCDLGFQVNNKGCTICKCKEPEIIYETKPPLIFFATTTPPPPSESVSKPTMVRHLKLPDDDVGPWIPYPPTAKPTEARLPPEGVRCVSDGTNYDDGETWFDGCRRCFCDGGKEMCALIMCSVPKCPYTIIKKGDCCPSCYNNSSRDINGANALIVNRTVCHTTDGIFRVEGETWQMGACTQCTCYGGMIMCETEKCPPILCERPIMEPNGCCPKCPNVALGPSPHNAKHKRCFSESGKVYHHGETWRSEPCLSCACNGGSICFRHSCPPLKCNRPLLGKGQCCPTCPSDAENPTKVCEFEGKVYRSGDSWEINDCIFCNCTLGNTLCVKKVCSIHCDNAVKVPGKCCPICPSPTTINQRRDDEDDASHGSYQPTTVRSILVMPPQHRVQSQNRDEDLDEGKKQSGSFNRSTERQRIDNKEVRLSDHVFVTGISTFAVVFLILLLIIFILIAYIIRGRRLEEATPPPLPPKIGIPPLHVNSNHQHPHPLHHHQQQQHHTTQRSSSTFLPSWMGGVGGGLRPKSTNVECQGNVYIDTDKLHNAQSATGAVVVFSPAAAAAAEKKSGGGGGKMTTAMDTMDKQNFSNVYIEQQKRDSSSMTSSSSSSLSTTTTTSSNNKNPPSSTTSSSNINSAVSSMEKIHKIDPERERHVNNYSKPPVGPSSHHPSSYGTKGQTTSPSPQSSFKGPHFTRPTHQV